MSEIKDEVTTETKPSWSKPFGSKPAPKDEVKPVEVKDEVKPVEVKEEVKPVESDSKKANVEMAKNLGYITSSMIRTRRS